MLHSTSKQKTTKKNKSTLEQIPLIYQVDLRQSYFDDLLRVPETVQHKEKRARQELRIAPTAAHSDVIKKLVGFDSLWRYRLGDYRLIYAVIGNSVQLLALGHRRDIYRRFTYDPDKPDENQCAMTEAGLFPDSKAATKVASRDFWEKWAQEQNKLLIEQSQIKQVAVTAKPLPTEMTIELLQKWHIPDTAHGALLACKTESDLLDAPIDAKVLERILELVYPKTVEQIANQPVLTVENPEDIDRCLEDGLSRFLLKLDPEQEKLVDWALEGPTMIKGGPGSGKSTVTLYRIRTIMAQAKAVGNLAPSFIFLTYTNALVEATRQLLSALLGELGENQIVSTVDRLAKNLYLQDTRKSDVTIAHGDEWLTAVKQIREYTKNATANKLSSIATEFIQKADLDYLALEFESVIDGRDIANSDAYMAMDREGLGRALRPREVVWEIYEATRRQIKQRGHQTVGDIYRAVSKHIQQHPNLKFDYIFVDEAQDLTPSAMRMCVELAKTPKNIFLAADSSQSIYRRGFSYNKIHEKLTLTGKTRALKRNYRTTREIALAAVQVLQNTQAGDAETLTQSAVYSGPRPELFRSPNAQEQLSKIIAFIRTHAKMLGLPPGSAAVLCSTNDQCANIAQKLCALGLPAAHMAGKSKRELKLDAPEVKVITIHSAKGLEFPIVALPFIDATILPRPLKPESADDPVAHANHERRLLFVGLTRAMRALLVTTSGSGLESEFVSTFGANEWILS